ncbi:hypothetical protein D6D23_04308 [Aureobasidium pullulans]|nr:hypothetical protein D6D23_04308 [Aureobasidium pullulans]
MNMDGSRTPADMNGSSESARPGKKSTPVPAFRRSSDSKVTKPKRSVVHVARWQCDGLRPTCQPCAKRYEDCVYDVEANTTRSNALKRKNEDLAKENAQLHELYDFLRNRPFVEAEEIFRRIRSTENPLDVLRHVATADTLMAQTTTSNMQPQSHDAQSSKTNGSHVPRPGSTKYDPVYDRQ